MIALRVALCLLAAIVARSVSGRAHRRCRRSHAGDKVITNSIGMKLALIPAGKFLMGSPAARSRARSRGIAARGRRSRKPFYMGVYEVTQGQWRADHGQESVAFQESRRRAGPSRWSRCAGSKQRISASSSVEFADEKKGRPRLPSADRGGMGIRLPGRHHHAVLTSGTPCRRKQANFDGNYPLRRRRQGAVPCTRPAKVGSYAPNAWGLVRHARQRRRVVLRLVRPRLLQEQPQGRPEGARTKGVVSDRFRQRFLPRGPRRLLARRRPAAAGPPTASACNPSEPYRWVGFRVVCAVKH